MHHIEHKQSEDDHQKTGKKQRETSWKSKDAENSLIQEDSWEWKDSLIAHRKDHDQNDDELTVKRKHAELISRMLMQVV